MFRFGFGFWLVFLVSYFVFWFFSSVGLGCKGMLEVMGKILGYKRVN